MIDANVSSKHFDGQNVYFDRLIAVAPDQFTETLSRFSNVSPGSIVWNFNEVNDKIFIKCKDDSYVYFSSIVLSGLGNLTAQKFQQKVLKTKVSKPIKS